MPIVVSTSYEIVLGTTYDEIVEGVVQVVEAVGALIMILGGLYGFVRYARHCIKSDTDGYPRLRRDLSRAILLGVEVLIVADIILTIIVDRTLESVGVLGLIVVIRILLSFSLEVEIDGFWPWNRWRTEQGGPGAGGAGSKGTKGG